MRDTDAKGRHANVEMGTTISPWKKWSFNPTYGYKRRNHDFNHLLDADRGLQSGNGFPAAVLERDTEGQNWGLNTTWKPTRWLKTSLAYEGEQSDYTTTVGSLNLNGVNYPAGSILAGNYDSHSYRFTTTLTPAARWFWTGTASYTDSRIVSGINDNNTIAPYDGDLYTCFPHGHFYTTRQPDCWPTTHSVMRTMVKPCLWVYPWVLNSVSTPGNLKCTSSFQIRIHLGFNTPTIDTEMT
jgi:hypothetical protein